MRVTVRGWYVIGSVFFAIGVFAPWDLLPWAATP